jgi:hypothetical protein
MSTVRLQEMGGNIVTSVIGPLVASFLSNMNQRMRTSYVPVMAVTGMSFHQHTVVESLVKEGNSAAVTYERFRGVYGDVCMGASSVRRWMKLFKDGNTDVANQPRFGRPRTAATERNKQKVDELIRQDRRLIEKLQRSLE